MLNDLLAAVDRYPEIAVATTLIVIAVALFFVADIIVGRAEDDEEVPRAEPRGLTAAQEREIAAALAEVRVRRDRAVREVEQRTGNVLRGNW